VPRESRGLLASMRFKKFEARVEEIPLPGKGVRQIFRVVVPGAVAVLPVINGREVVLLKQYRPAVGEWLLEAPAGGIEPGETPEETAARELVEETGYKPGRLEKVAEGYISPGYTTEYMYFYIAWNPEPGKPSPEEGEVLEVMRMPIEQAFSLLERGELRDVKTMLLLALLRERMAKR
jgi:ADP-ribose pyrophosphatase